MSPFQTWEWIDGDEDASVASSPDGLRWSADLAYYAGKPSRPVCLQSFAEFLKDGVPDDYHGMPPNQLEELRAAVELAVLWKPPGQ